nr:uncharacterized protein LOC127291925 [Lolium perenne]
MPGAPAHEWGCTCASFPPINTTPLRSLEKKSLPLPLHCTAHPPSSSLLSFWLLDSAATMKTPHFTGEVAGASWAHEVKQALRDKLRWSATGTAGVAGAARPAVSVPVAATAQPSLGEDGRGSAATTTTEDPIRRVMFLAP